MSTKIKIVVVLHRKLPLPYKTNISTQLHHPHVLGKYPGIFTLCMANNTKLLYPFNQQFFIGWWIIIDATATNHFEPAYHTPGAIASFALFM